MDFTPSDSDQIVAQTAREFSKRVLAPRAREFETNEAIPRDVLTELGVLGLLAVNVPEAYGGSEAGVLAYSLAMSEIAEGCASTAVTMAVTNMVSEIIVAFGNEAQRNEWIPRLARGETLGAFALSEPDAGSDPSAMQTTARRDGSHWVIDGQKQWITNGAWAGPIIIWAKTDPSAASAAKAISCFLVARETPGLQIGAPEDKMGLRGSNTVPLTFDGLRVSDSALLGELGAGFRIAMTALDGGRIGIGSQAIGIAEGALNDAVKYARERTAFGQVISEFQAIQWMLADSRKDLDAARCLVHRAALGKQANEPFTREASMGKLFASEAAWRVVNRAVQVLGGYGYTREFPVEQRFRDARVTQIYEGTSEIQRLVIARSILR